MQTILVVDDDQNVRELVTVFFAEEGYTVLEAADGMEALECLAEHSCDVAIVDIMMPVVDGYELTEDIRRTYDIPVILLTAKNQLADKEKGYRVGTDDYLVKPFEPKELLFRVEALLRRYQKNEDAIIRLGPAVINREMYEVKIGSQAMLLPLKEFELLFLLASHPRQVFSREHLIEKVWGMDYEGDERTVDVHVKRLRERFAKLTDAFQIKTIRGVGYALEVDSE
ncbi:response regulator transcription factor [Bacillus piscicola]|uniref:response regulator transcription factor n=1 Tax=Bacillus piscicola TaxID=1632684 RepID=UPI001F093419